MKFGIAIRNMGPQSSRETIRQCASSAEALGYDALFVSDHLCIPPADTEGSGGRYLDVLTTLAYLAGATARIRLGISVLVLPYRPAVLTAKQVATIQELSGERMVLAVGVGWMKPEFEALGVEYRKRGQLASETLRVIHHLFAHEAEPFKGSLVEFPAFVFKPRPKRPPIWIGGNGAKALERVIEYGDGWHPMLKPEELAPLVRELRERMHAKRRIEPEIVVRRGVKLDDLAGARNRIETERAAGATYFIFDPGRYHDASQFARDAERFISIASEFAR